MSTKCKKPKDVEFCLSLAREDLEDNQIIMFAHPKGYYAKEGCLSDEDNDEGWCDILESNSNLEASNDMDSTYLLTTTDKSVLTEEQWRTKLCSAGMVFNQDLQNFIDECEYIDEGDE